MRSLKDGDTLWFAPDQDYGARHSVFVPFFGVEAATITATSRFARMNNSPALMFSHTRNPAGSGYTLSIGPVLEGFPSGDDEVDARRINAELESRIRQYPEQYLWLHRRFKTSATNRPLISMARINCLSLSPSAPHRVLRQLRKRPSKHRDSQLVRITD